VGQNLNVFTRLYINNVEFVPGRRTYKMTDLGAISATGVSISYILRLNANDQLKITARNDVSNTNVTFANSMWDTTMNQSRSGYSLMIEQIDSL
jgi:hypothetical protein